MAGASRTAALATLLLSLGALVSPTLLDFFSPAEIAWPGSSTWPNWPSGAGLLLVYTLLDEALPRALPMRLAICCAPAVHRRQRAGPAAVCLLRARLHAPAAPLRLLSDAMSWGLPAVFLAVIADVHQRALRADSAAHAADLARVQQGQGEAEQQLALLQAQIEPHFLFNMLGNVRRLYRTSPQAGAEAIDSLMRYLRTAMPQVRNASGSLGDEMELVRAYLELYRIRMGDRLAYAIEAMPALQALAVPADAGHDAGRERHPPRTRASRRRQRRGARQALARRAGGRGGGRRRRLRRCGQQRHRCRAGQRASATGGAARQARPAHADVGGAARRACLHRHPAHRGRHGAGGRRRPRATRHLTWRCTSTLRIRCACPRWPTQRCG
jgi:hypothetical protein